MSEGEFATLVAAVQRNCDISDARHAREMTLCTYLLEMRELYRWQAGIPLGAPLPREAVGAWINAREAHWETLADADYAPLSIAGEEHAPFAVAEINRKLARDRLVYGAGIGRFGKPHFFLARLERAQTREGATVLVCGKEHARDLTPMPAGLQRDTIVVRRQALAQWVWERVEAWAMKRLPGAMSLALAAYGFEEDREAALAQLVEEQIESAILHELGERRASERLGHAWEERLACSSRRKAEVLMRAVRDNLADCLVTLPTLLERESHAALLFWLANLDGMRRALFPRLSALELERIGAEKAALTVLTAAAAEHFTRWGLRLLAIAEEEAETLADAPHEIAF